MNTTLRVLAMALVLVMAADCDAQGPDVPRAVDGDKSVEEFGNGVQPVVVNPNAAEVGASVDDLGAIASPATEFNAGATVYISVHTQFGRKVGDQLDVFWFHDDGRSRIDDRKPVTGPFTVFELIATDAGPYNVEVDANRRPIALVQFTIK